MTSGVFVESSPVGDQEGVPCPNSVLGKAQLLLGAFQSGAYRLRLSELSRRSGVPKASAYRLAQELVQWGLLDRSGDAYQLGLRIFELGQRVPVSAVLRSVARPLLADLFAATRATIHLAVLDGTHVMYLEKLGGKASVHTHSQVGGRLPAACTATGKALLAHAPEVEDLLTELTRTGLTRLTSRTVGSVEQLRAQLDEVRARGFALEQEETAPGLASVAVPLAGADETVYGSVSATAPVAWTDPRRVVPVLLATSATIVRALEQRLLVASDG
ncbi:IclR family transcriptional regulator [Amycolatopsis jiangsuensis]|uniref:DNA-binding IclR family transcriptional regulator n=1 Tax=Amycolatopsis jiangsuensis TaxID=1181879 RepID=A0A840IN99_9PSEU|nr:IclR family transcriptional regulator [Amycolatopsis jiangsuensis]MBB4683891.1 DNA-binding IclR family transcriptional regulator [Amycolatopsis jiangsuensis]